MRAEDLNADFEEKALNHKNYSSTCFKHEQDAGLIYSVVSSSVQYRWLSWAFTSRTLELQYPQKYSRLWLRLLSRFECYSDRMKVYCSDLNVKPSVFVYCPDLEVYCPEKILLQDESSVS